MFKKGSFKRSCMVLAALQRFTTVHIEDICKLTGMPRSTVGDVLAKLESDPMPGVTISREGPVYTLVQWDDIRQASEVLFDEHCADPELLTYMTEERATS